MRSSIAHILPALSGAHLHHGVLSNDAALALDFDGVSTDTRTAGAGQLFVALRGEVFDAHDFLQQVVDKGVVAVVVEKLPEGWTLPAIVVPDTLAALGQIANYWRRQFALPVIGVTGSNGKTTVKEMIASILAAAHGEDGRLATRGNLNNEIGVPLTLFRLNASHRSAVVELGMNHPGEIGRLSAIAAPTIGMVNNAQREHQEFMHTVEAVARENGSVLAALPGEGVAVFPHGDEFTPVWRELSVGRRVLTFGLDAAANVSCTYTAGDFGAELEVTVRPAANAQAAGHGAAASFSAPDAVPRHFSVSLQAAGEHNVRNALAAIACTYAAGIDTSTIRTGLEAFAPVNGRLQKKQAANGALLIDDSYNANPDSVRAAIDVLARAKAPRVLVLGDMGEVGTQGKEFHEEVAAYAATKGIERFFATGTLAAHMAPHAEHHQEFDALLQAVSAAVTPDATVLIKGSRFMKMERVVQHLIGSQHATKETH
ncbi:UDP-N-acetylmuramoyl-tripeptide--D-alanyl-D-alanine ligase [Duganella sp. Root1480D1]|uniref:UDP-N-acetylmuramoyl-tripeptide--D-alanyl-D- alanine ligase n=1 Tax=Duganella sp. Root1480D1 TaxID=1736471 RepID=UPI00070A7724|nr:UDP-N-acetylmuramoyl-tripeptide--D-alanyl-D-alanine ligase [Duganella sp. Root1480D1]KQZ39912.1 UDP-N-acetylmuramoyl-tripeptide--D-alanyl-D-alanine ligase [Duganella sp. Root1480D1]